MVFLGESSPFGMCRTFVEAAAMANNVHLARTRDRNGADCNIRATKRPGGDSMDRPVKVGSRWCGKYIETGQALVCNDVEKHKCRKGSASRPPR